MDGLLLLASVMAIGLVMWWTVANDHIAPQGRTHGLFAMEIEGEAENQGDQGQTPVSKRRIEGRASRAAPSVQPGRRRGQPGSF